MRRHAVLLLVTILLAGLAATVARAEAPPPARVYAAFALKGALDETIAAFERQGGAVKPVYGPSPALARQIEEGAPADIFISADQDWMDEVARHGLIRPASRFDLVGTHLVLAARTDRAAALHLAVVPGFPLAAALGGGRIAICDPMMNPAGKYARDSLTRLGVWQQIAGHVAPAENSGAAIRLVQSGAVPLAIVFASDLVGQPDVTEAGSFPDDTHPPILFPAALTASGTGDEAPRFLSFLRTPAAQAIFARFGFFVPQPRPAADRGQRMPPG